MTDKQREQFNQMFAALKKIASGYQTPEELSALAEAQYGLDYWEVLEMAYENLQAEAAGALEGVKWIAKTERA